MSRRNITLKGALISAFFVALGMLGKWYLTREPKWVMTSTPYPEFTGVDWTYSTMRKEEQ